MKTIKLRIKGELPLLDDMRVFSSIVRMAFNRYQDGLSEKGVRAYVKERFACNSWIIQSGVKEASYIYAMAGTRRVVFGGRTNLKKYLSGKLTKEEFKYRRLMPVCSCGEAQYKGNRLFQFKFDENLVVYKRGRGDHISIHFCPVKKRLAQELALVQELAEEKKLPVTVKFTDSYLFLTYDEALVRKEPYRFLNPNRILGIDMNPNAVGISIIMFGENDDMRVLYKEVYALDTLTRSSGKAPSSKVAKRLTCKLRHETLAIAHRISTLVDYWKCSIVALEDLDMKGGDLQKGRSVNCLCNNKWERRLLVGKLNALSQMHGYELVPVNPAYSSIVGNFVYGNMHTPDMVAASIEIARRAYKKFEKGWFYPKFNVERLDERWKQTLAGVKTWKELAQKVKESGLKYRFLLADCIRNAVFSKSYNRQKWKRYIFAA